jgi:hypothetical protein
MQDYFETDESGAEVQQQPTRRRTARTVTATGLSQPSIGDLFAQEETSEQTKAKSLQKEA